MADLDAFVLVDAPIVFTVGKADVLAEFALVDATLHVTIAVVEKGGEGVLPQLVRVVERAALDRRLAAIEWSILARNRAIPNPKLQSVLERLGFEVRSDSGGSEYYWLRVSTNKTLSHSRG